MPHRTTPRITLFNHKGGVGKTTLTVNLAFALSMLGKRVLLVDSDPQCNLTSYLVASEVVDRWLDQSESQNGKTVWSALFPLFELNQPVRNVLPFERAPGVFLIPGDIRLSNYEIALQQSWIDCLQRRIRGFRETGALSEIVGNAAEVVQADFVLYDVGPNIGPLNRAILLDCDFFIVPGACDYFSTRALKTLGASVSSWIKDWKIISQLAPSEVRLFEGRPTYLGYILQRFRMYGGEIASSYQEYARQINKQSYSDVAAVLKEIDEDLAPGSLSQFKLGQIKDFGTLANLAQQQGVAMSDVTGGSQYQKEDARLGFRKVVEKIIDRIEKLG